MTPNFALSLSFDGISLLQRVPDGWHLVGEVPLDAPDLHAALADLRTKGLKHDPNGLHTKLVIPGDQIRFMTLDTAEADDAAVRQALDGATPYALDDLVIDTLHVDGRTHIAAVARETLDEAEAFAVEHDFNPVAFVAVPDKGTITQEIFFGATKAAGGAKVDRDNRPVIKTGVAADPVTGTEAPAPAKPDIVPDAVTALDRSTPVFASRSKVAAPTIEAVLSRSNRATSLGSGAMPGGTAPQSTNARSTPPVPARTAALSTTGAQGAVVTPLAPPAEEPLFTRRKEPPAPILGKGRAASPAATRADSATDAPVSALTAAAAPMISATPRTPPSQTSSPQDSLLRTADRRKTAPTDAALATSARRGTPRYLGLILTAVLLIALLLVGLWASTLTTDGIAAWFRGDEPTVAVTSPAPTDTTTAVAVPVAEPEPVAEAVAAPVATEATAPSALAPQESTEAPPPLPIVRATVGRVLSPDEADRVYAATGVYQRAPRIATTPDSTPLEGVGTIITVAAPAEVAQPDMPPLDTVAPDAVIAAQATPPGPDVVFARDTRGNILATPEGITTPQGAIVVAGAPDVRPVLRPGTPRVPAAPVSPVLRPADLVPAPDPVTDASPEAEAATEAANSDPAVPAVETPASDAAQAFAAGPPPLRPVLRPSEAAALATPDVAVTTADYTGVRPQVRPDGLVAAPDMPTAAQTVIAAYTGARPVLRPADLAPATADAEAATEAEPEPVIADINAVAAAIAAAAPASSFSNRTALAVSVAPRPAPRPRNFSQVVARAQQAATPPPAAAATRTAAVAATPAPPTIVAPSGNIPGGVARAATMDNAMNLRQMNLVGVYGKPNARRALIRLGNGRYVKVEVGSTLDGGQVTAIGDSALNFVKRGRVYALTLPG
ncbi:hypothetical protein ACOI1H_08960 [Loktanella sp. DJP18]|uniref:hypothetical protein n=1 Tax=Loktanella sp. DJP18 TaxID=3409788 RepID=UPI003BB61054